MALTRGRVLDAALAQLQNHGLPSLSMRQVAAALDVQPGALYWHVKSKQDLLALLAERILAPAAQPAAAAPDDGGADDVRGQVLRLRAALLAVRDGAEVVSFAQALRPGTLTPLDRLRGLLASRLAPQQAAWGARTLVHYLLGAVAEEQNHTELARAGLLGPDPRGAGAASGPDGQGGPDGDDAAFAFGVDAILKGLGVGPQ